jgi:ribosome maturation protein SDO1
MEWRSGVETDIDEVLQIHSVFQNVSKGQVANQEDLRKCFKTDVIDDILHEILKKGELQVGEKERGAALEQLKAEIAGQISSLCVNPETNRPYPPSMIQKALEEIGFSVRVEKSGKSQALEGIRKLVESKILPIQRARMRLRVTTTGGGKEGKRVREKMVEAGVLGDVQEENFGEEYELVRRYCCV